MDNGCKCKVKVEDDASFTDDCKATSTKTPICSELLKDIKNKNNCNIFTGFRIGNDYKYDAYNTCSTKYNNENCTVYNKDIGSLQSVYFLCKKKDTKFDWACRCKVKVDNTADFTDTCKATGAKEPISTNCNMMLDNVKIANVCDWFDDHLTIISPR